MKRLHVVLILGMLMLASCSQQTQVVEGTATGSAGLTPYHTATTTPTLTPPPPDAPTPTLAPTVTPTPWVYTVKANDTLIVIAYRNGLTLDELKDANPDVNPYNLAIGTKLNIPAASGSQQTLEVPNPTPAPIPVHPAKCIPSITGGLYCFAMIENDQETNLENLTAEFRLTDPITGDVISQSAQFPLNHLQASSALPFYTYFSPPVAGNAKVLLQVLTASASVSGSDDYMFLSVTDNQIAIASDGLSAVIKGNAVLEGEGWSASRITLAAVAFNSAGEVIGVRRVELEADLQSGENYAFEINVYSTGGKIAEVKVYGEAQP